MGMGRELLEEHLADRFIYEESQLYKETWVTRDGRKIKITDMDLDHLENTINYLNRHGKMVPKLMYEVKKIKECFRSRYD